MPKTSNPSSILHHLSSQLSSHQLLCLTSPHLIAYVLEQQEPFAPGELILIISQHQTHLFHSPLVDPTQLTHLPITFRSFLDFNKILATITSAKAKIKELIIEPDFPYSAARSALASRLTLTIDANLESTITSAKSPTLYRDLKKACNIAASALLQGVSRLKPGISEQDLVRFLDSTMITLGASRPAFPTIVAFAAHTARPHHLPTTKKFRACDPVLIDIGARYGTAVSDMTRTIVPPTAPTRLHQAKAAVISAYHQAYSKLKLNTPYQLIDQAARSILSDHGYTHQPPHTLGHGLGLSIHEPPLISPTSNASVQVGDVITLEPGVYLPNRFGIRHENTILIRPTSTPQLTLTHDPTLDS